MSAVPEPESRSRRKIGVFPDFSRSTFRLRFEKRIFFRKISKVFRPCQKNVQGYSTTVVPVRGCGQVFSPQRTRGTGPLVPCCGKKLPVKLKNTFWERKRLQLQPLCFFRKTESFCPSVFLKKQSLTQLTKTCRGTVRRWLLSGGGRTFSKKTQGLNLRSFY